MENQILETHEVKVVNKYAFVIEKEDDDDNYYQTECNGKYIEGSGSYKKERAYQRYLDIISSVQSGV